MYDPSVSPPTLHFYKSKLIIKVNLKFQAQNLLEVPRFKTALHYRDRFTFGHEKLDRTLDFDTGIKVSLTFVVLALEYDDEDSTSIVLHNL